MVLSALISFFGGTAFRWIASAVMDYYKAKQDHSFELDRLKAQADVDAAAHARNMEMLKTQAELGVKTIEVQRDADVAVRDADAFKAAVGSLGTPTGITWVDTWNGIIRPALATIAGIMWVIHLIQVGFVPNEWDLSLEAGILGLFIGGRIVATGK